MQDALFPDADDDAQPPQPKARLKAAGKPLAVLAVPPDPALQALSSALPRLLRLGTSSWTYPGWASLVWDGDYPDATLSKHGLTAYAQHPLFRAVSLDRSFYRPLTASQYARYAAQVPDDFRFVVKAPSLVTDALVRNEKGQGLQVNPAFLDPVLAVQEFVQPALEGLGHKIGALVFQLSPLSAALLGELPQVLGRLRAMLLALPALAPVAPDAVVAIEVRDRAFLTPDFVDLLRAAQATYCLGLHAKMPPIAEQLFVLRALWPGPLVCRWNLNLVHGAYGYEAAHDLYSPYDKVMDPDPATRHALAQVMAGTVSRGQRAFVTVSNKAEGCAPMSVAALAQDVVHALARLAARGHPVDPV